jgi:hypothetical protein
LITHQGFTTYFKEYTFKSGGAVHGFHPCDFNFLNNNTKKIEVQIFSEGIIKPLGSHVPSPLGERVRVRGEF